MSEREAETKRLSAIQVLRKIPPDMTVSQALKLLKERQDEYEARMDHEAWIEDCRSDQDY